MGIALFFRKIRQAIRDDEAEVAGAGVTDARVVHLIENAVTQGEPHPALAADGRTEAALRAPGPPSGNTRPARGKRLLNHVNTSPYGEASPCHSPRTGWRKGSGRESRPRGYRAG